MNKDDCKTICLEIGRANLNEELSIQTTEHLRLCNECREFYEREMRLRQLVASMPQVEAPSDFDFRLRSRLASQRNSSSFSFASFGIPSIAVAALLLLLGGVLVVRNISNPGPLPNVATKDNGAAAKAVAKDSPLPVHARQTNVVAPLKSTENTSPVQIGQHMRKQFLAVQKSRSSTKDLSSVGATVVKHDSPLAGAQLPLVFPMQTLTVSVDDGRGVARTISFPTVSFGSERVLTRARNSFQGSVKGDW